MSLEEKTKKVIELAYEELRIFCALKDPFVNVPKRSILAGMRAVLTDTIADLDKAADQQRADHRWTAGELLEYLEKQKAANGVE